MSHASFEVTVGDQDISLRPDNCAVVMFRTNQEVDYLAVELEDDDEQTLRVFNNPEFVRWLGGFSLKSLGVVLNEFDYVAERRDFNGVQMTFREVVSTQGEPWNPPVIIKEQPNDTEMEMFIELNTGDFNSGLEELLG